MAFGPENKHKNGLVEGSISPDKQLDLFSKTFERARRDETKAWGGLFKGVENFTVSDWLKALTAGALIGAGWWLEGRQKLGRFFGDKGQDILAKVLKNSFREISKK